jgi:hypothetical protein
VATERQRSANRANAGRSAGPRTRAGKAVASGNARKHGLAAAVRGEPGVEAEIEQLARAIADEAGRPDLVGLARRIAEAEMDLRRIRRSRATLAKIPGSDVPPVSKVRSQNSRSFLSNILRLLRRKVPTVEDITVQLYSAGFGSNAPDFVEAPGKGQKGKPKAEVLERYERRATSRRKSAIRDFDLARSAPREGLSTSP